MIPDEARKLLSDIEAIRYNVTPDDTIRLDLVNAFMNSDNIVPSCEKFCDIHPLSYDKNRMWWIWNKQRFCFERADDTDLFNKIYSILKTSHIISNKIKSQLITAFQMAGRVRNPKDLKKNWIQFRDSVIEVSDGEFRIFKPEPGYMYTNPIDFNYKNVETPPERIDKIFRQWVRPEDVDKLYEIIGYCMLPDNPIHRIFCLIGSGRNGKSKYLSIIRRIIGLENVTAIDIEKLKSSNFESSSLFKKLVAMAGETNFNTLENTKLLKELSGEDLVRGEFKHISKFDFINYAKTIIATNSLPTTLDKTEGFYGRWIIIDFPNKFDESRDVLGDVTDEDYENLANYALFRLKKLLKTRLFTNEGSLFEKTLKYEEKSNPINKFINTYCEKGLDYEVFFWELRDAISEFFAQHGYRKRSDKEISSLIKDLGFETGRKYVNDDKKWTVVYGLRLKTKDSKDSIDSLSDFVSLYKENKVEVDVQHVHNVQENNNIFNKTLMDKILSIYSFEALMDYFTLEEKAKELGADPILFQKIHDKLDADGRIFTPRPGFWKRL